MDRIFLIGNGFDLAHGLPTSYWHLVQYAKEVFNKSLKKKEFENSIFKLNGQAISAQYGLYPIRNFDDALERNFISTDNDFFAALYKQFQNGNWVDIESFYYHKLKSYHSAIDKVNKLNKELLEVQRLLISHLNAINSEPKVIPEFKDIFRPESVYDHTTFINFNYTNTLEIYLNEINLSPRMSDVKIHGSIDEQDSIIFGYGDHFDPTYKELENLNNNAFLENIKYPRYTLSGAYKSVMSRFQPEVHASPYEVHIIGLSCGISDRTLLKAILDNPRCSAIYLYYHKDIVEYKRTTTELTRHFDDKSDYLKKIVPFPKCRPCPQV